MLPKMVVLSEYLNSNSGRLSTEYNQSNAPIRLNLTYFWSGIGFDIFVSSIVAILEDSYHC